MLLRVLHRKLWCLCANNSSCRHSSLLPSFPSSKFYGSEHSEATVGPQWPTDLWVFIVFWINRPEPQPLFHGVFDFQRQPFQMAGHLFQVHPGELFYRCHRDGGFNGALRGWENHAAELHGGEKRRCHDARHHQLQYAAAFESSRKHWLCDAGEFGILQ